LVQEEAQDTMVYSAAISPDGRLVATGDDQSTVRLWDPARGEVLHHLRVGERGRVWAVRFAPDGRTLAAASEFAYRQSVVDQGVVRIWDLPSLQLRHELRVDHRAVLIEFSADSRRVAVASWDIQRHGNLRVNDGRNLNADTISLFDVATGKKEVTLPGHDKMIRAMAFARDGKTLASAGEDNTFRFWDLATGRMSRWIPIKGHRLAVPAHNPEITAGIGAVVLSTDLKTAVTSGVYDDQLLVWDLRVGRVWRTIQTKTHHSGYALAVSPDGRLLAWAMPPVSGKPDAPICIWDMNTKREVLRLERGVTGALSLSFSADGKTLVSGMWDTTALIWDISAAYDALKRPQH
jgi:WD40 repeat protein